MSYKNNALRLCRTVKSGKMVMNDKGAYVPELVPVTTFTSKHKPGSYGALYKECKHNV